MIHDTAADLVLTNGLSAATVDAIVERAGCSRRTFFNYFATKEDAILGMREPRLDLEDLRAAAGEDPAAPPFERTMRILIWILGDVFPISGLYERRRLLLATAPSLKERFVANFSGAEQLVQQHLQDQADRGETPEALGPDVTIEQARVLLMLAGTIVRYAVSHDPEGVLADRDDALRRATSRFREVIEHTL